MSTPTANAAETCRASVRTDHGTPTRADRVARAVAPDNTASMTTRVDGTAVTTDIDRDTTGGLQSTVDDYVVNLGVADAVLDAVDTVAEGDNAGDTGDDATDAADRDSDTAPPEESTAAETKTDDTTQL